MAMPRPAFTVNALTYAAPIGALLLIRSGDLHGSDVSFTSARRLRDGLRHTARERHLLWPILLVGAFGFFTVNLPVTLASYAQSVLHTDAGGYGLLSATTAVGALAGALLAAQRTHSTHRAMSATAASLALAYVGAACAPGPGWLVAFLIPVGALTTLLNTSTNTAVQLGAPDALRGRVMGVYVLVFVGSGALGGPVLGAVNEAFGPRAGLCAAGVTGALAVCALWFTRPAPAHAPATPGSGHRGATPVVGHRRGVRGPKTT
ncbi:Transmembrane secretion effector [Streptomyces indicus]|uniref:Transmembrane secretion effector n=2 Tax=Streptomyces indicus TaxID=417292 RepID=A0A1G9A2J0_9ACTN|nr:Transmembrane secretion effector [Streptomyces indicus]